MSSAPVFDFGDGGSGTGDSGPPPNTEAGTSDTGTDAGANVDAGPRCNLAAQFRPSAYQPFQNVNPRGEAPGASLSPDELTLYFEDDNQLKVARRSSVTEPFKDVQNLPMVDGGCGVYHTPAVTRDEKRIFFGCEPEVSSRIMTMSRNDKSQPFGSPFDVRFALPDMFQLYPRVYESPGRVELWATLTDASVNRDHDQIYQLVSTDGGAGFGPSILRTDLNDDPTADAFAVLTPDGLQVIFHSGRGHPFHGDILFATRGDAGAQFGLPAAIASLNDDPGDDGPLWISPDGCRLYYFSNRATAGGGTGYHFYVAERPK